MKIQGVADAVFLIFAVLSVGGALTVAFSRNIVRSAFALLFTFAGVAGLYGFLGADFLAMVQVLVYIGGITILFLFVLFLTRSIQNIRLSNETLGTAPALAVTAFLALVLWAMISGTDWPGPDVLDAETLTPTTMALGDALLGPYLLPFELVSVMLLAVVIGAIALARKEIREHDEGGAR